MNMLFSNCICILSVIFYSECASNLMIVSHRFFLWAIYRSEEVVAVASMNYDPIVSRVAEVLGSGKMIKKRDVE